MTRYAGKSEKGAKRMFKTIRTIWIRHRIIKEISKLTKQLDDAVNLFKVCPRYTELPNASIGLSAVGAYSQTHTLLKLEEKAENSERANAAIIAIGQANQEMLLSLVEADQVRATT